MVLLIRGLRNKGVRSGFIAALRGAVLRPRLALDRAGAGPAPGAEAAELRSTRLLEYVCHIAEHQESQGAQAGKGGRKAHRHQSK
jgi:hypothetical protein